MKKITILIIAVISSFNIYAQTSNIPNLLNLVAVVRDNSGVPVTTQVDVKLEISTGALFQGGILRYCEQIQNIQPNTHGEIAVEYGFPVGTNNNFLCATGATNSLTDGQWENGNTYYRLSWRITGNPNYVRIDSGFFASVPYSFASRTAESISSFNLAGAQDGNVLVYNQSQGKWLPGTGGTTGTISAGTGISVQTSGTNTTITNTAPDQTVTLTAGSGITITGSYPNFTVSTTSSSSLKVPTVQAFNSSGSYTTPSGALYLKVRLVGGGGGGGGSSTSGASGLTTIFGNNLLVANGGAGGGSSGYLGNSPGGVGGIASNTVMGMALQGGNGQAGIYDGNPYGSGGGAMGASSPFGGAGGGINSTIQGVDAVPNTGSGGGGTAPYSSPLNSNVGSAGGGAGGYIEAIIQNPSGAYNVTVGSGGAGGQGTIKGGAGGSGIVIIETYFQ